MKWLLIPAMALIGTLVVSCDPGARQDLPQENQEKDAGTASVFLMPDGFPNITHKCEGTTGMWTTTDRGVWIVYEDIACDGAGTGPILDNIAGGTP